jgi:ABC-2 type transport system permease protein
MLAITTTFFNLSFLAYGLASLPFILVLFLFGIALGIFGSALVLRLGPASEWFIWPIPAIISPFVGVLYPLSTLPHWMQAISKILPPSYVFEGLRAVIQGEPAPLASLGIATILAFLYIFLAYWLFVIIYRNALRSGLIARYSAESVS